MFKPEVYEGTGAFGIFCRVLFRLWSEGGDLGIIDELLHKDFVNTNAPFGEMIKGPAQYKNALIECRKSIPDMEMWAEEIIWDEAKQTGVVRFKWTGTHTGVSPLFPFPPSGNKINADGMVMIKMKGTQMIREWAFDDHLGYLMQMGVIPSIQLTVSN